MNTSKVLLLGAALFAAAGTIVLQAQTPARITADNVNLRAKALPAADVVGQVDYDARLDAFDIGEEWVEVAAPDAVDLWIMKSFVVSPANTVGANRVNVRAGPSINYNIVCTLSLGDAVVPRGEELQDWIQIAPPAGSRVWVSRDYVEILSGDAIAAKNDQKTAENGRKSVETAEKSAKSEKSDKKASSEAKKEKKISKKRKSKSKTDEKAVQPALMADASLPTPIVSPSVPVKDSAGREIPVPPPANLKLIPLQGQGRITEVEGELRAAPLINEAPTRYRVVRWQNNRWQILCHVYGEAAKFRSLQDKRVSLKGREYWIQGAAAPVLVPEQVRELPAAGETPPEPEDGDAPDDAIIH